MTETPEARVARLQRELASAKVAALQHELADAQAAAGLDVGDASGWSAQPISRAKVPEVTEVVDTRLAPAPRPVPPAFRLMVLPWSWWTVFVLFMVATAPIAVWIFVPIAGAVAAGATFLAIVLWRLRRYRLQLALLKWGELASVSNADLLSRGTYYSGTTYQNVRLAQAHGWRVERRWYSGPASKTQIDYQLNGTRGTLVLRGLPYAGGVILADSRDPRRALCVSSFAYDLDRDPNGNWVGKVPFRVAFGSAAMAVVLLVWTAALMALFVAAAASH